MKLLRNLQQQLTALEDKLTCMEDGMASLCFATGMAAIGAVVHVTAGGVTQTRLQDGGVHHRGQNHARLHFGLAKHTQVDKISVHWPSGQVQELQGSSDDDYVTSLLPLSRRVYW